jgi:hypothetical protein
MTINTCCTTGHVVGHPDACGDCDPCGAASSVPGPVKRLIREVEEWRGKYGAAAVENDILRDRLAAEGRGFDALSAAPCPYCGERL